MLAAALLLAVSIDALDQFRALNGHWKGTFEWTGVRTDRGEMSATYSLTGNGSAVIENLERDGVAMMTTVYHLDRGDLRATHYCAARNQPRLKARKSDPDSKVFDFDFVDATNLESADSPHVIGLQMRFIDANHIVVTFRFHSAKGDSFEKITLTRAS